MQKWLLGGLAAAFVLGVSGSGAMAEHGKIHPPKGVKANTPPRVSPPAKLLDLSGGKADPDAALKVADVSPVFGAASPGHR